MIKIEDLSFSYGKTKVLENLNMTLDYGIHGILGANGMGKTTLFKLIINELSYIKGSITIDRAFLEHGLGYLPQHFMGYPEMKVIEFLNYIASIKESNKKRCKNEIAEKMDIFNISSIKNKSMGKISGGQLRRVGLAQAFLFEPTIILLDEPTTGLDPSERTNFRKYLSKLSEEHVIIISTHIVSDLKNLANKVYILKNKNFVFQGDESEIEKNSTMKVYSYITNNAIEVEKIESQFNVVNVYQNQGYHHIRFISDKRPDFGVVEEKITLEDYYLMHFGGEKIQ